MKRPRLTCSGCKKRTPHDALPYDGIIPNSFHLSCSRCSTLKGMGVVQSSLVAQGLPVKASEKIQRMCWNAWEPFESMTPTEKGFILSSIGVKINYVEAFLGKPVKLNARQRKIMKERYNVIVKG